MANLLSVEPRKIWQRYNRRLRDEGKLPAFCMATARLLSVTLARRSVGAAFATVRGGGPSGRQWRFAEVSGTFPSCYTSICCVLAGDKVTVEVLIELRGEAPGANDGGVVEQLIHLWRSVAARRCPRSSISASRTAVGGHASDIIDLPIIISVDADSGVPRLRGPVKWERRRSCRAAEPGSHRRARKKRTRARRERG
jgi:hypothetical protein